MLPQTSTHGGVHPCLVVAHADPIFTAMVCRAFRRQGWDVYQADSGPAARRLAHMMPADLLVLDTNLPEESGWLTCEKLTTELPHLKVILVGDSTNPREEKFAHFVGALRFVDAKQGVQALLDAVAEKTLPAAS